MLSRNDERLMPRQEFRFNAFIVVLWLCLGVLIALTSIAAVVAVGVEALYLVVTGWIVGPFFLYWIIVKIRAWIKGT